MVSVTTAEKKYIKMQTSIGLLKLSWKTTVLSQPVYHNVSGTVVASITNELLLLPNLQLTSNDPTSPLSPFSPFPPFTPGCPGSPFFPGGPCFPGRPWNPLHSENGEG